MKNGFTNEIANGAVKMELSEKKHLCRRNLRKRKRKLDRMIRAARNAARRDAIREGVDDRDE